MKVIALIPAYNEEGKIGKVVSKCKFTNEIDEILVIDDGSVDNTKNEAKEQGATVISHKKNRGVGAAIRNGINYAIKKGYDVCVVMGGDDQDDPSEVNRLLKPLKQGYDLVQGSRYLEYGETKNITPFRKLTTKLFTLLFKYVVGFPFTDSTNGFRVFKTIIFDKIDIWKKGLDHYELEPYILIQAVRQGFKVTEIPVTKSYDIEKGFSKMTPIISWFSILKPVLKEFFSKF